MLTELRNLTVIAVVILLIIEIQRNFATVLPLSMYNVC